MPSFVLTNRYSTSKSKKEKLNDPVSFFWSF